ncbi:hypothetical protein [Streptomyces albidoflavus]|uniref:hypothetical protein n=1 Tax=Streptomyces albidoflavus TaxID=1886 RepID=UPI00101E26DB|nr:hypothetical protein [Streptomyces albidoflavus]RZD77149.1 hypothetical protein C0Q63_31910 [Streptomyces albidoflavus]
MSIRPALRSLWARITGQYLASVTPQNLSEDLAGAVAKCHRPYGQHTARIGSPLEMQQPLVETLGEATDDAAYLSALADRALELGALDLAEELRLAATTMWTVQARLVQAAGLTLPQPETPSEIR